MIPEDSTLRRHYLTELKYKQQSQFDGFISCAVEGTSKKLTSPQFSVAPESIPYSSYLAAFAFVLLLIVLF
jgi:hypothetical protein